MSVLKDLLESDSDRLKRSLQEVNWQVDLLEQPSNSQLDLTPIGRLSNCTPPPRHPLLMPYVSYNSRHVSTKESMQPQLLACPHCGGELMSEEELHEKKDACYYKVKSRYKVWPSAHAGGALVQCRKKGAKNWGKAEEAVGMPLQETVDEQQQIHLVAAACAKWAQKTRWGADSYYNRGRMKDIAQSAGIWPKLSGLLQAVLDPQDLPALVLEVDYESDGHNVSYYPLRHVIHIDYKAARKYGLAKAIAHELQHAVDEIKSKGMVFVTHPGAAQTPEDKARYWRHHSEVNARLTEALLDLSKLKISRERFPKVLAGLLHEYALAPHGKYALDPSVYRRLLSRGYVFYTQSQQQQQKPTPNLWQRMKQLASAAANAILGPRLQAE